MDSSSATKYQDKFLQNAANTVGCSLVLLAMTLTAPPITIDSNTAQARPIIVSRAALVDSLFGKYSFLRFSSDDILRDKIKEKDKE